MPDEVVGRDQERHTLAAAIERASAGEGSLIVLEGPAGIGKSTLIGWTRAHAKRRGLRAGVAQGHLYEAGFALGVVQQLVAPVLAGLAGEVLARVSSGAAAPATEVLECVLRGSTPSRGLATHHALYWLLANLADERPMLLVVDDAHWADVASLRFVDYVAHRLEGLPMCIVIAVRAGTPADDQSVGRAIAGLTATRLPLPALDRPASMAVAHRFLPDAPDEILGACVVAAAGNPFLLRCVAAHVAAQPPDARMDVSMATVPDVEASTAALLDSVGADAAALARAVAILGESAHPTDAVHLSGLSPDAAAVARDRLVAADLLRRTDPPEFVHPLRRSAVIAGLGPGERSRWHRAAATQLMATGARSELVAGHLLRTSGAADADAARALSVAGRGALARGQPADAFALLERALAEPAPADERAGLLADMAVAATQSRGSVELWRFAEAADATGDLDARVTVIVAHAQALIGLSRFAEAYRLLDGAVRDASDRADLILKLEAQRAVLALDREHGMLVAEHVVKVTNGLAAGGTSERELLAARAYLECSRGMFAEASTFIGSAFSDLDAATELDDVSFALGVVAAVHTERFDIAAGVADRALRRSRDVGDLRRFGLAALVRCIADLSRGDLAEAEANATAALAALDDAALIWRAAAIGYLAEARLLRGDVLGAKDAIANAAEVDSEPASTMLLLPSIAQAIIHYVTGNNAVGVAMMEDLVPQVTRSVTLPIRRALVLGRLSLGQRERALELATAEVDMARRYPDGPGSLGAALRVLAATVDPPDRIPLLEESVRVLRGSAARLQLAASLTDLGGAHRRANRRSDARPLLKEALADAQTCRARPLVERAATELEATGERVRRGGLLVRDRLTASEERVAGLAVGGATNKEIAQSLFVTRKTIEMHLNRAYRKLGITSRAELAGAMALVTAPPARTRRG